MVANIAQCVNRPNCHPESVVLCVLLLHHTHTGRPASIVHHNQGHENLADHLVPAHRERYFHLHDELRNVILSPQQSTSKVDLTGRFVDDFAFTQSLCTWRFSDRPVALVVIESFSSFALI